MKQNGERQIATQIDGIRADHRARYDYVADLLAPADSVFDAGCGIGYGSHTMAQVANRVVAVDCAHDAVNFANDHWGAPNLRFAVQNLHSLKLAKTQPFDVVTAFEIIEHLVQPDLFLEGLKPYVTPETRIFISSPNEVAVQHTVELNPFHIRHFSADTLSDLLKLSGYEVHAVMAQHTGPLEECPQIEDARTIIVECRLRADAHAKAPARTGQLVAALQQAEHEILQRAHSIRRLQGVIRSQEKRTPCPAKAVKEAQSDLVQMLEGRLGTAAQAQLSDFTQVAQGQLQEVKAQQSAHFDGLTRHLSTQSGNLSARVDRLVTQHDQTEARAQLHQSEITRLTHEAELLRGALSDATQAQRDRDLESKAIVTKLHQLTHALDTQTAEIEARTAAQTRLKARLTKVEEQTANLKKRQTGYLLDIERLKEAVTAAQATVPPEQGAQIDKLKAQNAALRTQQATRLARFNPARPTIMGLARVMMRYRFFVPVVLMAPFYTARNVFSVLFARS